MKTTTSLKKNHEFRRLYSKGRSVASKYVVVYARKHACVGKRACAGKHPYSGKDGGSFNRLGITVSTKLGGAVQRNRIRRRLKEIYRLSESSMRMGYDIVIVARTGCRDADWSELRSSVLYLFRKLGLLK